MKTLGKYVVVALIAFAIGAFATSKWLDSREVDLVVDYDTVYIDKIDSTGFTPVEQSKVNVAPVVMTLPEGFTTPTGEVLTDSIPVETNKYTGTQVLENGTIDYEIYADRLLAYDFKLTTEDKVVTRTITKTLPSKSRLYFGGGLDFDWVTKRPQGGELGLMYNRRQKWQVGVAVRQDFSGLLPSNMSTTFGVKFYIGL
jgi:hypothetical protein